MKRLCIAKLLAAAVLTGCTSQQSDNGTTNTTQVVVPEMFKPRPAFQSGVDPAKPDFEDLKAPPDFTGVDVVAIVPPSDASEEKPAEAPAGD